MHISILPGSPRTGESNSAFLLEQLRTLLEQKAETEVLRLGRRLPDSEECARICASDAVVMGFPLYVDSIPSHFLEVLIELDEYMKKEGHKSFPVYLVIVNGFYEGCQNTTAVRQIQNWCARTGNTFAQAIGYGAGDMLLLTKNVPMGHGTNVNIDRALRELADNILNGNTGENIFGSPNFPKPAWKFMAEKGFFNALAKKNGLKRKEIKGIPGERI